MKNVCHFLFIVMMISLAACGKNVEPTAEANLSIKSIINGSDVESSDPLSNFQVMIIITNEGGERNQCSGTIVSSEYILTAAHCFDKNIIRAEIRFGINQLEISDDKIRYGDSYEIHPDWKKVENDMISGDVALLHFKNGLPQNYIAVKIVEPSFNFQKGLSLIAFGFGRRDEENSDPKRKLQQTNSSVINEHREEAIIEFDSGKSNLCAGDSGGPTFVKIKQFLSFKYIQIGVHSAVRTIDEKCSGRYFDTDLRKYAGWISQKILL